MDYYAHCVYITPDANKYCIINKENDYTPERNILVSTDAFDYFTKHHTIYEGKYLSYEEYDEDTFTTLYQVSFEDIEEFKMNKAELLSKKDNRGLDIYRVKLADSICGYITVIPNWIEKIKSGKFKLYQVDICKWDFSLSHYNQLSYFDKSPNAQFTHEYWYNENTYLKGVDCKIVSYEKDFYYNVNEYHREQLYKFLLKHKVKRQVLKEIDKYILFEFINFRLSEFPLLEGLVLDFLKELSIIQKPYLKNITYKMNGREYYEELPYTTSLKGKIEKKFISKKTAFAIELPKWPQYAINGDKITEKQALEIIRRTDIFFTEGEGGNNHSFNRDVRKICKMSNNDFKKKWKYLDTFYYLINDWISCNSGGVGYHGWCHPDGTIGYCNHGYIKYPDVRDFYDELKTLGKYFPYLHLYCTIMNADEGYATESVITLELRNSVVKFMEPIPFERLPFRGEKIRDKSCMCENYFTLEQIKKLADEVYNFKK